jgi:hypothetical protein
VALDSGASIDVLANDTDPDAPDADDLTICRLEPSEELGVFPSPDYADYDDVDDPNAAESVLDVIPFDAKRGTYTVDYYVCDYEYLTPATLTVEVIGRQNPFARVLTSRPGFVRFTNPGTRRAVIRYGSTDGRTTDGRFVLAPRTGRTVRVARRAILWTATIRTATGSTGMGSILRGIKQPARPDRAAADRSLVRTPADRAAARLGLRVALRGDDAPTPVPDAPVTASDEVAVSQGWFALADVLRNDSDPDGPRDDLAICRASVPAGSRLDAAPVAGESFLIVTPGRVQAPLPYSLLVQAAPRAPRGTVEVTYWACDRQHLTRETVTVTVTGSQKVTARKVRQRPGLVRFTNPGPHPARVTVFGLPDDDAVGAPERPIARFPLPAGTSRNLRPGEPAIFWYARSRRGPGGSGYISRIR